LLSSITFLKGNHKAHKIATKNDSLKIESPKFVFSATLLSEKNEELSPRSCCNKHGSMIHISSPSPFLKQKDGVFSEMLQYRIMCIPSNHNCTKFVARFSLTYENGLAYYTDVPLPSVNPSRSKKRSSPY
jgi:hypothetical protein